MQRVDGLPPHRRAIRIHSERLGVLQVDDSIVVNLALGTSCVLFGLILLKLAVWPRRRGTTPYCRKCGYNLTRRARDTCPECGSQLSHRDVVFGERRRRPMLIVPAVLLCAAAIVFGVRAERAADVQWYRWCPSFWVLRDLRSSDIRVARKAWRELKRRAAKGLLSPRQQSKRIDACLAEQAGPPAGRATLRDQVEHLGVCYTKGRLSERQRATFLEQLCRLALHVRPKAVAGEPVPFTIEIDCRIPQALSVEPEGSCAIAIDGRPTGQQVCLGGTRYAGMSRTGVPVYEESPPRFFGTVVMPELFHAQLGNVRDVPVGHHTLGLTVSVAVCGGPSARGGTDRRRAQMSFPIEDTFEVVADDGDDDVKLVRDPLLRPVLLRTIRHGTPSYALEGDREIRIPLLLRSPPIDVAFDIIARVDGREHPIGTLKTSAGRTANSLLAWSEPPEIQTFDLILRTSAQAARQTVDLFEIWDGELTYRNVKVHDPQRRFRRRRAPTSRCR